MADSPVKPRTRGALGVFPTRWEKNRDTWLAVFITVLCVVTVAYADYYGRKSRSFSNTPVAALLDEPYQTLELWERAGVRGRILLLFDRHLNATRDADSPNDRYVDRAIQKNIVRRVIHVVPNAAWSEVEKALSENEAFESMDGGYRMVLEGVPVNVLRLKDIPALHERVLTAVNGTSFNEQERSAIEEFIIHGVVPSDVVTWYGHPPAASTMKRFGLHEATEP